MRASPASRQILRIEAARFDPAVDDVDEQAPSSSGQRHIDGIRIRSQQLCAGGRGRPVDTTECRLPAVPSCADRTKYRK